MTCEAGKLGRGMAAAQAVPRPGSVHDAAHSALAAFAGEQRLIGSMMAHESFDGILAEHVLALEEARDMLREGLDTWFFDGAEERAEIETVAALLDEQIQYIHALGSVAEPKKEEEEP